MRRVVWEMGAWLFHKRWGAYPKWWCTGNCLYLLYLLTTDGNINPLNQLIIDIRRFADLPGQIIPI